MVFILFSLLADSTDIDTTHTDSIRTYQIPEIFSYEMPEISGKIAFQTSMLCRSEPWNYDMHDLISSTNAYPFYTGQGRWLVLGGTGRSVGNMSVSINGRRVYDPYRGYADLLWFAPGMIDNLSMRYDHGIMPVINISTRVNEGEWPLSSLNYWSGAMGTTLFNIGYSRPFNDQIGVYMNGYYDHGDGSRYNDGHRLYRFYMNNYIGSYLRSDFIYYNNEYGFPGNDWDTDTCTVDVELLDFDLGLGRKNNKFILGIVRFNESQTRVTDTIPIETHHIMLSLQNINYLSWRKFLIGYGFEAFYNSISSGLTPGTDRYRLFTANIDITWSPGDFIWQVKNKIESANAGNFYVPSMITGYTLGKMQIFSRAGRYVRTPTYLETKSNGSGYDFFGRISPNPLLECENMWGGEIGINIPHFEVKFYDYYYESRIVRGSQTDLPPTTYFRNIFDQNVYGLALNSNYCYFLSQDTTINRSLAVVLSMHADHCWIEESNIGQPQTYATAGIGIKYESDRLGFAAIVNGRCVGERNFGVLEYFNDPHEPFYVVSPVFYLRFIALSASLRIENILNQEYFYIPEYQMPGRHILFGIKWDFRN